MLLDTDTDPSAVDLTMAKEIGLKLDSHAVPASGGGTSKNVAYETKVALINVGTLETKNVEAGAIDLSTVSTQLGKKIDGVLGYSFLKNRIVQIDYPAKVVRFFDKPPYSGSPPSSHNITVLSFHYNDYVMIDGVSVNGQVFTATLDTGSSGNFHLTPEAVSKLGLDEEAAKGPISGSVGYNGNAQHHSGTVNNILIGDISVDKPNVTFFTKGTGHDKKPWGLNIGNVFLKGYVVTVDYRAKKITLEKP